MGSGGGTVSAGGNDRRGRGAAGKAGPLSGGPVRSVRSARRRADHVRRLAPSPLESTSGMARSCPSRGKRNVRAKAVPPRSTCFHGCARSPGAGKPQPMRRAKPAVPSSPPRSGAKIKKRPTHLSAAGKTFSSTAPRALGTTKASRPINVTTSGRSYCSAHSLTYSGKSEAATSQWLRNTRKKPRARRNQSKTLAVVM